MRKSLILILSVTPLLVSQSPALSQSIMEAGGMQGAAAGLGAGMAAGATRIYQSKNIHLNTIEDSAAYQARAIQQYVRMGTTYEAKKDWGNAEKAFRYVLTMVARMEGVGSPKSVPALQHLVKITAAQNKLGDAIDFQRTVVMFKQKDSDVNPLPAVNAHLDLSKLYVEKEDYPHAEKAANDSMTLANTSSGVSAEKRLETHKNYAAILRKLDRESDAVALENSDRAAAANVSDPGDASTEATANKGSEHGNESVSNPVEATSRTAVIPQRNQSPAELKPAELREQEAPATSSLDTKIQQSSEPDVSAASPAVPALTPAVSVSPSADNSETKSMPTGISAQSVTNQSPASSTDSSSSSFSNGVAAPPIATQSAISSAGPISSSDSTVITAQSAANQSATSTAGPSSPSGSNLVTANSTANQSATSIESSIKSSVSPSLSQPVISTHNSTDTPSFLKSVSTTDQLNVPQSLPDPVMPPLTPDSISNSPQPEVEDPKSKPPLSTSPADDQTNQASISRTVQPASR